MRAEVRDRTVSASFAQAIETHQIRGGHIASITRNVAATARCVKHCLDAAYRPV